MKYGAVMFDFDGVIRHFDPDLLASIEAEHSLESGALRAAAFRPELALAVTTGQISRQSWIDQIGAALDNPTAASEWLSQRGWVDPEMMGLVGELRALGTRVALLTNGTSTLRAELANLGLSDGFDWVFNSAEIGFVKPDRRVFEYCCSVMNVPPARVYFTDDSEHKLSGALEIGIDATHFSSSECCRAELVERGLLAN